MPEGAQRKSRRGNKPPIDWLFDWFCWSIVAQGGKKPSTHMCVCMYHVQTVYTNHVYKIMITVIRISYAGAQEKAGVIYSSSLFPSFVVFLHFYCSSWDTAPLYTVYK